MAFVVLAAAAIAALLLAFVISILCLVLLVMDRNKAAGMASEGIYQHMEPEASGSTQLPYIPEEPYGNGKADDSQIPGGAVQQNPFGYSSGKQNKSTDSGSGECYTELYDAINDELDYSIDWENYEYAGNTETVMIVVDYPVILGNIPNRDILNQKIAAETEYFEEYYEEYSQYMMPGEVFAVYAEGFVTYMDEEIISIVFRETIYTDYWADCGLYCVNIDAENGMILDNKSMIQADDAFAVDFRTKSREQNGTIAELEYLTDQEIVQYLSGAGTGIVFYTPLGMEIGFNYGENYVTVTYQDYEKYLQRY